MVGPRRDATLALGWRARTRGRSHGKGHGVKFDTALRGGLVGVLGVAVVGATIAATQRSDYAFFDPLIDVKRL